MAMTRLYSRALKRKKVQGLRPENPGKNLSLVGVLGLHRIVVTMTFLYGKNCLAFPTYVDQVLLANTVGRACVVMDNLSSHKVANIREAIKQARTKLISLSPFLVISARMY